MLRLDPLRKALLFLTLALIPFPGLKGWNLVFSGIYLGRFQPFKFAFILWLFAQIIWIVSKNFRNFRPTHKKGMTNKLALLGVFLFFFFLAIGLFIGKGGDRGWSIYFSILLGLLAGLASLLDPLFPKKVVLNGLSVASFILIFFVFLEQFYGRQPEVHRFFSIMRDNFLPGPQWGSSISPSALAEFTIRTLPFFILAIFQSRLAFLTTACLCFLNLSTVTRGGLLSLVGMGIFSIYYFYKNIERTSQKKFKKISVLIGSVCVILLLIFPPTKFVGRYFSWLNPNSQNPYAEAAKRSANERLQFAQTAITEIKAHPLTGIGLDGFAKINNGFHTHNLYLEIAVSGGIGALFGLLLLMFSSSSIGLKSGKNNILLLYILGQSITMLFDARIYVSWLAITFFWFGGMAWALGRDEAGTKHT